MASRSHHVDLHLGMNVASILLSPLVMASILRTQGRLLHIHHQVNGPANSTVHTLRRIPITIP